MHFSVAYFNLVIKTRTKSEDSLCLLIKTTATLILQLPKSDEE